MFSVPDSVYQKGKNAVQSRKKLTDVYGEGVLTVRQCQNWFAKFRSGNFDVEDAPRSGRPVEADKDAIKALVDANRRITIREIGVRLNLSNSTVYNHLKSLGFSSKLDVCVHHVLTEKNLCRRIDVCDSLLKRHENDPFLKRIITGDEKGHEQKDEPAQTIPKADIHQKKLEKLNDALQQKRSELINRKGVVNHQDNSRPHTSLVTRQKLLQLEWDAMPHPPYSPNLSPSDYYLFWSLQNFLDGKTFTSNEEVKNHLDQFFASKAQKFYDRRIMLQPERWQKGSRLVFYYCKSSAASWYLFLVQHNIVGTPLAASNFDAQFSPQKKIPKFWRCETVPGI
ncbi:histone-lysine N-methyltransferase SETMAR [Trichonephila clavipes]|nr:histone-lysine N-methyltransferase SETMAR [Trichonephila clavipes]